MVATLRTWELWAPEDRRLGHPAGSDYTRPPRVPASGLLQLRTLRDCRFLPSISGYEVSD